MREGLAIPGMVVVRPVHAELGMMVFFFRRRPPVMAEGISQFLKAHPQVKWAAAEFFWN